MATTKPGSMNHRIATCAQHAVRAARQPLTVGEHRAAFEAAHGHLPTAYDARFFGLVRVGILCAVDGRTAHTRYAHADQPATDWIVRAPTAASSATPVADATNDADAAHGIAGRADVDSRPAQEDGVLVLAALEIAYAEYGRDVSTREVAAGLRAQGHVIGGGHPNAVRQRLATLSATRTRGRAEWHAPLVLRRTVSTVTGETSTRWRPAHVTSPLHDTVPASASDALRTVVRIVSGLLQRPVELLEVRLWMRQHADHPCVRILAGTRLSRLLPAVVRHDQQQRLKETAGVITWTGAAGERLVVYDGDRSRASRAPRRYAVEPVGPRSGDALLACRMLDVISTLECDDELRDIAVLERRSVRLHSPSLQRLATLRRTVLWHTVSTTVVETCAQADADAQRYTPVEQSTTREALVHAVTIKIAGGLRMVLRWVEREQERHDASDTLRDRHALVTGQLRHVERVRSAMQEAMQAGTTLIAQSAVIDDARCVGADTIVELEQLQPFLTSAAQEWGKPATDHAHAELVECCRHFSAAPEARARRLHGEAGPRVRVDRVEALALLYRTLPVVRASVAVTSAVELLGRVVRDIPLLTAVRDASRPQVVAGRTDTARASDHPVVWRAAVVALGLLGQAPSPEDVAISLRMDGTDRLAVVLAAVLTNPDTATETVNAMLKAMAPAADAALPIARRRIALGRLMTVVG
jgi:hypothetical protein